MRFQSGYIDITSESVPQESLDVAKYVYENLVKEETSFYFVVSNGSVFGVSGYVNTKKKYGAMSVKSYVKNYCAEFSILNSVVELLK